MNEIVINQTALQIKEYNGKRVVTFKDIDAVHERPEGTARRNFNANKKYFVEREDYFKVCANEIRTHKFMDISPKAHEDVTLITESGYLMLVKSFTDELSWQVQRELTNNYFKVKQMQIILDSYMIDDPVKRAERWIEEQQEKQALEATVAVQNERIEEMRPKEIFADALTTSDKSILVGDLAKILKQNGVQTGQKRLFGWLRANGYLMKHGASYNLPTQKSMKLGLFEIKETPIVHSDGHITVNFTVKVTGKGQQYFVNKFLGVEAVRI